MENTKLDPTLDRLLRHMAWGNAYVFERLGEIPEADWQLRAPNNEWSIAAIAEHLAEAAGFYVFRLNQIDLAAPQELEIPMTREAMGEVAKYCAGADKELRKHGAFPDSIATFQRVGETIRRARSSILAQSIHHATEHRAQIAGILSGHKIMVIDLDAIDLWGFGDFEGLGE